MSFFNRGNSFGKYKARSVEKAGRRFDSKAESALHDHLLQLEKLGEIRDIKQQVRTKLTLAEIVYIPDFSAIDIKSGTLCFYEMKGFETDVWRIKRKLWFFYGLGPLYIFKGTYKKLFLSEVIIPKTTCPIASQVSL